MEKISARRGDKIEGPGAQGRILERLRTLFGAGTAAGLTDGQLLERFASRRADDAEAAFAALVSRHGPMVRRTCRSLLPMPMTRTMLSRPRFSSSRERPARSGAPNCSATGSMERPNRAARTLKTRAARRLKHEAREAAMAQRASLEPIQMTRATGNTP